jgi:small subunit ribosomal protein S13
MSLYGIGRTQAFRLCGDLGLNPFQKLDHIPETDFEVIKSKIETTFEPQHAVMKRMGDNILAKVRMGSYQGLRHQMCLPCHGQRTRSNAKTQRKLGQRRAELFNIPLLSKKAKQNIGSGGIAAGSKK